MVTGTTTVGINPAPLDTGHDLCERALASRHREGEGGEKDQASVLGGIFPAYL